MEAIRFWSKVDKSSDCWQWQSAHTKGYGLFHVNGKTTYAHRLAYELEIGPIPEGLCVLHRCDNPLCVNPDHLFLGTHADNVQDKVEKGRQVKGEKNWSAKLTEKDVRCIRRCKGQITFKRLAEIFEVDASAISLAMNHKTWVHIN